MYLRNLFNVSVILLFSRPLLSAHSQTKNEVGLMIGKTITPSQTLSRNPQPKISAQSPAVSHDFSRTSAAT